jgi:hypothetical protein
MSAPIADGVMAATYKLVQQAMSGQWQEVPKTIQERRDLLDKLSSSARPQDQEWLSALRQAMNESDAAVATMAQVAGPLPNPPPRAGEGNDVAVIMDMLGKGG